MATGGKALAQRRLAEVLRAIPASHDAAATCAQIWRRVRSPGTTEDVRHRLMRLVALGLVEYREVPAVSADARPRKVYWRKEV